MRRKVAVMGGLVGLILTGLLVGYAVMSSASAKPGSFSLVWRRSGGIAGVNDVFKVSPDGFAAYASRFSGSFNTTLSREALAELKALVLDHGILTLRPTEFQAKAGAADFFVYELEVTVNGTTYRIVWVDAWAAEPALPLQLTDFQTALQAFIEDLASGSNEISEEEAGQIASNFIKDTSTFRFDGVSTDFTITGTTRVVNEPPPHGYSWLVTITYYTAHAGHGDRTGRILLPVVTKHEAHVGVLSDGRVLYATCDGVWDLSRDEPVPQPTGAFRVIAVVNDVKKVDVTIDVRVSDGVTRPEAETITLAVFRAVMGDKSRLPLE